MRSDILDAGKDSQLDLADGRLAYRPPSVNPCLDLLPPLRAGGLPWCAHASPPPHRLARGVRGELRRVQGRQRRGLVAVRGQRAGDDGRDDPPNSSFSTHAVRHFHQSAYAQDFLRRSRIPTSMPLSDYTTPEFTDQRPASAAIPQPRSRAQPGEGRGPLRGILRPEPRTGRRPHPRHVEAADRRSVARYRRDTSTLGTSPERTGYPARPQRAAASSSCAGSAPALSKRTSTYRTSSDSTRTTSSPVSWRGASRQCDRNRRVTGRCRPSSAGRWRPSSRSWRAQVRFLLGQRQAA